MSSRGSFRLDPRDGRAPPQLTWSIQDFSRALQALPVPRTPSYALIAAKRSLTEDVSALIQVATSLGWQSAVVTTPHGAVQIEGTIADEAKRERIRSRLSERVLVFIVRARTVELWEVDSRVASGTPSMAPEKLADLPAAESEQLEALLHAHCEKKSNCQVSLLLLKQGAPFSAVTPALTALAAEGTAQSFAPPTLLLVSEDLPPLGEAPNAERVGSESPPPEVIQRIVRDNYRSVRYCYAAGLGRNAKLRGKLSVRFVIDLDGSVKDAKDGGSEIPDERVIDCAVKEFGKLHFPKTNGSVVTVVYPIMLSPG